MQLSSLMGWKGMRGPLMRTSVAIRLLPLIVLAAMLLIGAQSAPSARPLRKIVGQGDPIDPAVEEAIRALIVQSNNQQVAAVLSGDSSEMRATSTDRYYREMVRINRSLREAGVTAVELVDLEWGPILLEGSTAEVTTYETWAITTPNGRVVQPRERNLYWLVLEDGTWKIAGNDHPDQPLRGPST
jgi:hypothetical protein